MTCRVNAAPGQTRVNQIGKEADRTPDKNRGQNMDVNLTGVTRPRVGRDHERDNDARDPLKQHQSREELIGLAKNLLLVLLEELVGAIARSLAQGWDACYFKHIELSFGSVCFANEQPNTNVWLRSGR